MTRRNEARLPIGLLAGWLADYASTDRPDSDADNQHRTTATYALSWMTQPIEVAAVHLDC